MNEGEGSTPLEFCVKGGRDRRRCRFPLLLLLFTVAVTRASVRDPIDVIHFPGARITN